MGITFLKVKIINPERPGKSQTCEFLVDSGAVYSVVPQSILKKLGIWKSACKRDPRRGVKIGVENGPTAVISVR